MSARLQVNEKYITLPVDAQNLDTDISSGEEAEFGFERLLKKLTVHGAEVLAVSDRSFFYIFGGASGQPRYLMRDKLYHILSDSRLTASPLIKELKKAATFADIREKPFIAYSLLSSSLPEHLFYDVDVVPVSIDEFIKLLVEYAESQSIIEFCNCKEVDNPEEKESVYRLFYGSFLDTLEFLRVKYSYGESNGEPCIILDKKKRLGVIILPLMNQ